ncbi:prolyl 4-hydroxylase subunit alpha-2 isoform X1 [Procambarus clarkii]|uniref:prolyl 4-hydroxylase subunit alpha-2 isoform X1 n=1 Tax=Procambarus clarkii TaxID=6728 RepID=UPI00374444CE
MMMARCQRSCGGCELTDRVEAVRGAERSLPLPPVEALDRAATMLAVLQRVYNLSMSSLVNGRIFTVVTSVRLNLWDCFRVALSCESEGMYSNAWVWYQQSLAMTSDPELSSFINGLVLSFAKRHDETWRPDENHLNDRMSSGNKLEVVRSTTLSACQYGIQKRSREGMMCHVSALGSAFLLLQPAKQEILSLDPLIVMIHDAITNNQADQLIDFANGTMAMDTYPERLTTFKLFTNNSHPVVEMMVRKVNYFTGLLTNNTISTTELGDNKIRNYGAGGHIGRHVDVRYKHGRLNSSYLYTVGDRLLTCVFYLNKVTAGGSTNFFKLDLAVPPEKGSAVYFYNLKKNGDFDFRMYHSGCPVLLGSKWVGLKWVRENDNFLTYPCSLDPNV